MKPDFRILISVGSGVLLGIFFHYLLYRFALPAEPFIYFSF
jgi:hypothetical protein